MQKILTFSTKYDNVLDALNNGPRFSHINDAHLLSKPNIQRALIQFEYILKQMNLVLCI